MKTNALAIIAFAASLAIATGANAASFKDVLEHGPAILDKEEPAMPVPSSPVQIPPCGSESEVSVPICKPSPSTLSNQIAQMKEMHGAAKAWADDGFPVVPGKPNRLALEYRLATHVEALARKYGQLDQAGKRCNIEGSYFEEDSLADVLGNALPDSSVGIAKRAYEMGQTLDTPPCDQIGKFMNRLLEQVERHKTVIGSEGSQLFFMNAESGN